MPSNFQDWQEIEDTLVNIRMDKLALEIHPSYLLPKEPTIVACTSKMSPVTRLWVELGNPVVKANFLRNVSK